MLSLKGAAYSEFARSCKHRRARATHAAKGGEPP